MPVVRRVSTGTEKISCGRRVSRIREAFSRVQRFDVMRRLFPKIELCTVVSPRIASATSDDVETQGRLSAALEYTP